MFFLGSLSRNILNSGKSITRCILSFHFITQRAIRNTQTVPYFTNWFCNFQMIREGTFRHYSFYFSQCNQTFATLISRACDSISVEGSGASKTFSVLLTFETFPFRLRFEMETLVVSNGWGSLGSHIPDGWFEEVIFKKTWSILQRIEVICSLFAEQRFHLKFFNSMLWSSGFKSTGWLSDWINWKVSGIRDCVWFRFLMLKHATVTRVEYCGHKQRNVLEETSF